MSDANIDATLYDRLYEAIAENTIYAAVVREAIPSLPAWIVPLSVTSLDDLIRLAELSELQPGRRFADLACGLGAVALWIAEHTGASCTGVDFSAVAIRHASKLAGLRGLEDRASFVVSNMVETPLESRSFDAVLSVDALQFVDPHAAANEISRILRPGGIALVRTWEALSDDLPRPTMARDYVPIFERAGFNVVLKSILDDRREWLQFFTELDRRAPELRKEGGDAVESILQEAAEMLRRSNDPPRTRRVLLKVTKR